MTAIMQLRHVTKQYGSPPVTAIDDVSLRIDAGEFVAIVGPSGSGKSSLLNVMGTLDRPDSGTVRIAGHDTATLNDNTLAALRARHLGFVFQHFHLADGLPAVDNVAEGLLYTGTPRSERRAQARTVLDRVGLTHRLTHRPHQLSGGERQRVAIARALVGAPPIVLADEPTGALDSATSRQIETLLRDLNNEGTAIVVITHDPDLAARVPRQIRVRDGAIIADERISSVQI